MDNIIRPTIAEIKARISEIENLNLLEADIDNIKELLKLLFTGYALSTPVFDPGLILFRGIKYSDKPSNISFLSYRKVGAAQGRANRQNEPLFYCATMREIPFFELDVKPGDKLVISKWKTATRLLVNNIGYTKEVFKDLSSNRENQEWNKSEKLHPEITKEENVLVQNFLASRFSQPVPKDKTELYKLTIAIAEKHYIADIFQGLLYPTIPMKANGDNFALRPSFIESGGLEFVEAEWIEITKEYDFKYDINVLDWANSVSQKGEVEWKGRLPQWTIPEGEELFFFDRKWQTNR
ncbi:MAG: hypothetical protein EO766_09355 [Hydrotalea sp. AMD]|uniref:hypothetical protein n=1 Tax=Hydrotalea sp. AMD TaxID=2501297 RepID=UPI000941E955|nr:hypothetical protein [Hydrotalea sp. AMD]RWZ87874.1 MAG: hypothetical protein EO766_09355 [Hydrotalea sp. AMD]